MMLNKSSIMEMSEAQVETQMKNVRSSLNLDLSLDSYFLPHVRALAHSLQALGRPLQSRTSQYCPKIP